MHVNVAGITNINGTPVEIKKTESGLVLILNHNNETNEISLENLSNGQSITFHGLENKPEPVKETTNIQVDEQKDEPITKTEAKAEKPKPIAEAKKPIIKAEQRKTLSISKKMPEKSDGNTTQKTKGIKKQYTYSGKISDVKSYNNDLIEFLLHRERGQPLPIKLDQNHTNIFRAQYQEGDEIVIRGYFSKEEGKSDFISPNYIGASDTEENSEEWQKQIA